MAVSPRRHRSPCRLEEMSLDLTLFGQKHIACHRTASAKSRTHTYSAPKRSREHSDREKHSAGELEYLLLVVYCRL